MTDVKMFMAACIVMFLGMFAGLAYDSHNRHECRVKAIEAKYTGDQIYQICR